MYNLTDSVFGIFILFFLYRGWKKGFFRTLLGPLSLLASVVLAYFYYERTENMIVSLAIGLLGPMVLRFMAAIVFWVIDKSSGEEKKELAPSSRLAGCVLSVTWGGGMFLFALVLIAVTSRTFIPMGKLGDNIVSSFTYSAFAGSLEKRFPFFLDLKKKKTASADLSTGLTSGVPQSPEQLEQLQQTPEYKDLLRNEKIKSLASDEEVMEHIKNQDYMKLLSDPRIFELMQDRDLVMKIMKLNKVMIEQKVPQNAAEREYLPGTPQNPMSPGQ